MVSPLSRERPSGAHEPGGRAPAPLEALVALAPGMTAADPRDAIDRAIRAAGPDETILVTGSLYLVGTVRAHLLGARRDPVVGL